MEQEATTQESEADYKIKSADRERLIYYLKNFYSKFPQEKYTIFHCVRKFKERLKQDKKDAWAGVVGETGSGKSLFVLMFMILFGRPCDLKKNVCYIPKGDEIKNKFIKLNLQCLLIDEAAREMRAVNWQSKSQQSVNVTAMTDRFKNNMVFLNMPNFNEFTKTMRMGNLKFRFIVLYRTNLYARIIVQMKSKNWRSDDQWLDAKASEIYTTLEKKYGEISNEMALGIERSLPSTIMDFIIPNLELILPNVTKNYEYLKIESRKELNKEEDSFHEDKRYNKLKEAYDLMMVKVSKILYHNTLGIGQVRLNQKDIADALDISPTTLNKYLKETPQEIKTDNFRKKIINEEIKGERENNGF
jgi:hypothetical protein